MTWYNRSKKDTRDVTVYHASPEKITRFRPLSTLYGSKGLYFSPSYKSAIQDWAYYVKSGKPKTHPLYINREELMKKRDQLWDQMKETKDPQEKELLQQQDDALSDKLDEVHKKWFGENEREHRDKYPSYKYVFLHKVSIPKQVYNEAINFWEEVSKNFGMNNVFFWGWGEQLFIPANLLNQIKIISVKKLTSKDISQADSDLRQRHQIETYSDPMYTNRKKEK